MVLHGVNGVGQVGPNRRQEERNGEASGVETAATKPQRGEMPKPRTQAWVRARFFLKALKGREESGSSQP